MTRAEKYYREHPDRHPVWVAEKEMGMKLYDKQAAVVNSVAMNRKTAVKAANGSGKTTKCFVPVLVWWLSKIPKSKCIFTSASWNQIETQVFPAIRAHADSLRGWEIQDKKIIAPNGSWAQAISTDDPGKFEGHHGNDESPLLMVFDEAKSIHENIYTALDRCTYQRLFLMSSTGLMNGSFYEACTKAKLSYKVFSIRADDCPHISQEKKRAIITKYGKEHPLTLSLLDAEFMGDDDVLAASKPVKMHHVERCYREAQHQPGSEKVAFLDFAAGGDENVIAAIRGNKFLPLTCWRERDTMAAVGRFIMELRRHGFSPDEVWADEGGVGRPMCDAMRDAGWDIHRVNNGEASPMEEYVNVGAEYWFESGKEIEQSRVVLPPDEEGVLREQLTSRNGSITAAAKLKLESKEDMRRRGVGSPDRADAVLGAIWARKRAGSGVVGSMWDDETNYNEPLNTAASAVPGMNAGY